MMTKRPFTLVLALMLASITVSQTPPAGSRFVLSSDTKRAILITQPMVLIDNDSQFLDLIVTGRYLNKRPQPAPDRLEFTFFSRSAAPRFRQSHRLSISADRESIDLGRTSYAEFSSAEVDGKQIAVAKHDPEQKVEPFAPANSRLMAVDPKRKLLGEMMVRDGLTLDQLVRINSAKSLEIKLGSASFLLDPAQRTLLGEFTTQLTPPDYRPRTEKIDASLIRRQAEAPSAANQASLDTTLKWLKREAGGVVGDTPESETPFTYEMEFSKCSLTYRVEANGKYARARRKLPLLDSMVLPSFVVVTINLADLDPDSVVYSSSDLGENVHFQTSAGAEKIQLEFRNIIPSHTTTQRSGSKKLKAEHQFEIRDRRLGPQFVEAFAHAITLCQQNP